MIGISIIIPCFNVERTIIQALESIENQTFKDYEVILVDDGSTDSTFKIISNYNGKIKDKISIYKQINKGVSSARNIGLSKARGKYLSFLDADDLYMPHFLETLYREIEVNNCDISMCRYHNDIKYNYGLINSSILLTKEEILNKYFCKRSEKLSFWCALYKKEIIKKNNILFDISKKYGEDSKFFCEYLFFCDNVCAFIDESLYIYTDQPFSVMKKNTYRKTDNIIIFKQILELWKIDISDIRYNIYYRAIWSCAKDFANDDILFTQLRGEFEVDNAMEQLTISEVEIIIKISAYLYLIDEKYFRYFIRFVKFLRSII